MIKTFHEAPKSIFNEVQKCTDGDYALVNLFAENEEYFNLFNPKKRMVILDNGVFELGDAWNPDEFAGWVEKLQPTYYIVPDALENAEKTIDNFHSFLHDYKGLPGKIIGVAQGWSYKELVRCYKAIEPYCDMVGLSFDFSWYQNSPGVDYWHKAAVGRQQTLIKMCDSGVINRHKPHHLLGVMLPQEMCAYAVLQQSGVFRWLYSVDTSNPVVHGLKGIRYGDFGLETKESQKLYTMINEPVSKRQLMDIMYNIKKFRGFCNEVV